MFRTTSLVLLVCAACSIENHVVDGEVEDVTEPTDGIDDHQERTVDQIVQEAAAQVDVLWVVDNSDSAALARSHIADSSGVLLDLLADGGTDYHLGMIATDMGNPVHRGQLQGSEAHPWIDRDTEDADHLLHTLFDLDPPTGPNDEVGMEAILASLDRHDEGPNAGFYRDDAELHVIVLSDEDDNSTAITEEDFVAWFVDLKASPDRVSFSSMVGRDYNECESVKKPGERYRSLTKRIGGVDWSLCEPDRGEAMRQLAAQLPTVDRAYPLSKWPDVSTLDVWVVEEDVHYTFDASDWVYEPEENTVAFATFEPNEGAEIFIAYQAQ